MGAWSRQAGGHVRHVYDKEAADLGGRHGPAWAADLDDRRQAGGRPAGTKSLSPKPCGGHTQYYGRAAPASKALNHKSSPVITCSITAILARATSTFLAAITDCSAAASA